MKPIIAVGFALVFGLAANGSARAAPVVYTLYAVTDGKLGSQTFSQAQVTITLRRNTSNVTTEQGQGAVVYRNDQGEATVTLTQRASKSVAHIAAGRSTSVTIRRMARSASPPLPSVLHIRSTWMAAALAIAFTDTNVCSPSIKLCPRWRTLRGMGWTRRSTPQIWRL